VVEFVLVGRIQMEEIAEAVVEGVGVEAASGREFGSRIENAGDDHGDDEIAIAAGNRIEDGVQTEFAERSENGSDVAVRKGAGDAEGVRQGGNRSGEGAGQSGAESFDLTRGEMGEVGEGAGLDLAVLAVGDAEEEGGRGVAIGHGGDVHAYSIQHKINNTNRK
jgi:hypothetical protein